MTLKQVSAPHAAKKLSRAKCPIQARSANPLFDFLYASRRRRYANRLGVAINFSIHLTVKLRLAPKLGLGGISRGCATQRPRDP